MTIHSTPILVVSISDNLTNVCFCCVCCRDYVNRRELDAVTSSGVSSTVSKVMHDPNFNLIQDGRAIQASQNIRARLIRTFVARKNFVRALNIQLYYEDTMI